MTNPAAWKLEEVKDIKAKLGAKDLFAVVGIKGIRNSQLQKIRRDLKGKGTLKVVRASLLNKALDESKAKNLDRLKEVSKGQLAILTTSEHPAKLGEILEGTRQKAAARGGELADHDIIIEAKETSFPPGPMVSEFQKAGLQTSIEKGKIVIKKDAVFVRAGEPISREKAKILEKLEILPLTVGLEILGAYGEEVFYSRDALSLTSRSITESVARALAEAKSIALSTTYLVREIIPELLVKTRVAAESLAVESKYLDESNIELFILKAIREANALSSATLGEEVQGSKETAESKKEEKSEEKGASDEDVSSGLGALFG